MISPAFASRFVSIGIVLVLNGNAIAIAQTSEPNGETISANFRGKVVYDGSYEGKRTTPPRMPSNLSLGNLLGAALSSNTEDVQGGTHFEIEYEGNLLKGSWRQQGVLAGSGTMTGTRNGSACQIVTNEGVKFSAECSQTRFFARTAFSDARGRKYKGVIEANATSVVDYVERDRQIAIKAEQDRRAAAEAAARYAALPSAGPALTQKFDRIVQADSQGWAFNRYDAGSLRNVKIVSGKAGVGTYVMRGEYTYNGGARGWVMAEMVGPKLSCIQFWDAVLGCRGLRTAAQGQAMRNALVGALTSGGSSSSGSASSDETARFNAWTQQNRDDGLNDNGTPK